MSQSKFRLVTRSDFDGLVCAVLLKEMDLIDEIKFVHPKDMQDGKIEITARDITTNLPYVASAHLSFDHHESETIRNTGERSNHIISAHAPSAARVVYDYYGGAKAFPTISNEMMLAVDKADSAQFSRDEILASRNMTAPRKYWPHSSSRSTPTVEVRRLRGLLTTSKKKRPATHPSCQPTTLLRYVLAPPGQLDQWNCSSSERRQPALFTRSKFWLLQRMPSPPA
jgi:hypothetical protein